MSDVIRFLFDEDASHDILNDLRSVEPGMDILAVGEPGAPPKGTPDPAILLAAEALGRTLISSDRSTMPGHLADHFHQGRHTFGVILLRLGFSVGRYSSEIHLIWFATTLDEWLDRTAYIP